MRTPREGSDFDHDRMTDSPLVTIMTDFGPGHYPAVMKGVMLRVDPTLSLVDITHAIPPQNIQVGALTLLHSIPFFPPAVHVAVVDPGVGSKRRGVVVQCPGHSFVGPDNGLLVPIARRLGIETVVQIENPDYLLPEVSHTFHARDMFAPVGAHLASGVDIHAFGPELYPDELVFFSFPEVELTSTMLSGEIIAVDPFGNCITNIPIEMFAKRFEPRDDIHAEVAGEAYTVPYLTSYAYALQGEPLFLRSSFEYLELACNQADASAYFHCNIGSRVCIWLHRD